MCHIPRQGFSLHAISRFLPVPHQWKCGSLSYRRMIYSTSCHGASCRSFHSKDRFPASFPAIGAGFDIFLKKSHSRYEASRVPYGNRVLGNS